MLDYIHLSQTTPCDEPCAQLGSDDYMANARIETRVYIDQLKRSFGINPEGSFFKVVRTTSVHTLISGSTMTMRINSM